MKIVTKKYHCTPTRTTKIQESDNIKWGGRCVNIMTKQSQYCYLRNSAFTYEDMFQMFRQAMSVLVKNWKLFKYTLKRVWANNL